MDKLAQIGHDALEIDSYATISKLVTLEENLKKEIARDKKDKAVDKFLTEKEKGTKRKRALDLHSIQHMGIPLGN